jgi:hypothetical protein
MKKLILFLLLFSCLTVFGQTKKKYREIAITGATTTLDLAQMNDYFILTGSGNLGAVDFTITTTGAVSTGIVMTFYYDATMIYNSTGKCVILGCTLNATQAYHKAVIEAIYKGGWVVNYIPNTVNKNSIDSSDISSNFIGNGLIYNAGLSLRVDTTTALGFKGSSPTKTLYLKYDDTTITAYGTQKRLRVKWDGIDSNRILAKNVTYSKIQNITRGSLLVGGASNRPTERVANSSNKMLIGDGTDVQSGTVAGDVTVSYAAGTITTTLGVGVVNTGQLATGLKSAVVTAVASFDTLEQDTVKVWIPFDCYVEGVNVCVTKTIEATNDGTLIIYNYGNSPAGTPLYTGVITGGSTVGTTFISGGIAAYNEVYAGQPINIYTHKTEAGGRVLITFFLTRF